MGEAPGMIGQLRALILIVVVPQPPLTLALDLDFGPHNGGSRDRKDAAETPVIGFPEYPPKRRVLVMSHMG